ncbi:MAG: hypothetical protein M0041_07770 [Nitrospiraceae bacterium]|nr:hypothetical protein [Nitrospiraceae bacterium]
MRSVVRWNDRGEAQLLQLSIYLVISAMLGVMAFHFVRPMFHGAHVTQMETVVNNLRTAAGNYAEVNGSYGNISCATLQNAGLWPPNGCNGPVGGVTISDEGNPSITIYPNTGTTSQYVINIQLTAGGNYGLPDFQAMCNMFYNYTESCTPTPSGVTLVF